MGAALSWVLCRTSSLYLLHVFLGWDGGGRGAGSACCVSCACWACLLLRGVCVCAATWQLQARQGLQYLQCQKDLQTENELSAPLLGWCSHTFRHDKSAQTVIESDFKSLAGQKGHVRYSQLIPEIQVTKKSLKRKSGPKLGPGQTKRNKQNNTSHIQAQRQRTTQGQSSGEIKVMLIEQWLSWAHHAQVEGQRRQINNC